MDAASADFNLQGTVGMQGAYTDIPTANQTYTITAVNADKVEARKSFAVTVKPAGPPPVGTLVLTASSMTSSQGQSVIFTWSAPNATTVRIDAVSPTQLTGDSGQKTVVFKGKGLYQFALVATDANNRPFRSKPVTINVECPFKDKIPIFGKCSNTPAVEWK